MGNKFANILDFIDRVIEHTQDEIDLRRRFPSNERMRYTADGKESVLENVKFIREELAKLINR
ncbi:hypothetical protein ACT8ZR_15745 [Neobacillus sp. M.A.Huq-85]